MFQSACLGISCSLNPLYHGASHHPPLMAKPPPNHAIGSWSTTWYQSPWVRCGWIDLLFRKNGPEMVRLENRFQPNRNNTCVLNNVTIFVFSWLRMAPKTDMGANILVITMRTFRKTRHFRKSEFNYNPNLSFLKTEQSHFNFDPARRNGKMAKFQKIPNPNSQFRFLVHPCLEKIDLCICACIQCIMNAYWNIRAHRKDQHVLTWKFWIFSVYPMRKPAVIRYASFLYDWNLKRG